MYRNGRSEHKDDNLAIVMDWAKKYLETVTGFLTLTTEKMRDVKAAQLHLPYLPMSSIHAPNYVKGVGKAGRAAAAKSRRIVALLKSHGVNSEYMDLERYISSLPIGKRREITLAYFDYCGTVVGSRSADTHPLEAISVWLASLLTTGVMAVTFSLRSRVGQIGDIVDDYLIPLIRASGFRVEHQHSHTYRRPKCGNTMLFAIFHVVPTGEHIPMQYVVERDLFDSTFLARGYRDPLPTFASC